MPEFLITSPDGRKFRVTAPEGAKQEEVLSRVRSHAEENPSQQAATPAPPEPAPQAPAAPQKSSGGVIGQGLLGAAEGFASPVTKLFRSYDDWKKNGGPAGPIPQFGAPPQNKGEEYARSIGSAVGNTQSYVGGVPKAAVGAGGALLRAILSAVGGGAGAQAGGDVGGTPGAVIGGVLGGVAGGVITKPKAPVSNVPTKPELYAAKNAGYKFLEDNPTTVPPADMTTLVNTVKADFAKKGIKQEFYPRVFKAVDALENPVAPPTTTDLTAIRQVLTDELSAVGTKEAFAAQKAIEHIDRYTRTIPGYSAVEREAAGNYRGYKGADELDESKRFATLAANKPEVAGLDNHLRSSLLKFLKDDSIPKSPRVIEETEKVIQGKGTWANFVRWGASWMPTQTLRHILKASGGRDTSRRFDTLNELIRLQTPLAQQRGSTLTPPAQTRVGGAVLGAARQAQPRPSDNQLYGEGEAPSKALSSFMSGGLQGVANAYGVKTPEWSKRVGSVLSSPEANAALGVVGGAKPITWAGKKYMATPEQQEQISKLLSKGASTQEVTKFVETLPAKAAPAAKSASASQAVKSAGAVADKDLLKELSKSNTYVPVGDIKKKFPGITDEQLMKMIKDGKISASKWGGPGRYGVKKGDPEYIVSGTDGVVYNGIMLPDR